MTKITRQRTLDAHRNFLAMGGWLIDHGDIAFHVESGEVSHAEDLTLCLVNDDREVASEVVKNLWVISAEEIKKFLNDDEARESSHD